MSSYKAYFNLREKHPLSRDILHTSEVMAYRYTGQRPNLIERDYRDWLFPITNPKDGVGYLNYPALGRDTAESGIGCIDNRHLSHLVESNLVNAGDLRKNVLGSSHPMTFARVGGVIVVRA